MTDRVTLSHSYPSTRYYLEVDYAGQNWGGNYSTFHAYLRCDNTGSGGYASAWGEQVGWIDGVTSFSHSGQPFLPSQGNGQRWRDGPWVINVGHDGNGYLGGISGGMRVSSTDSDVNSAGTGYFSFGGIPRIPKRPSAPGTPTFSSVMPQSVTVSWTGSTDNAGSAIDHYLLRRWPNATATGGYTDTVVYGTSVSVSGLTPGQEYSFVVYAHNGSADNGGYSNQSGLGVVRMLSGARVKLGGVWRLAIPYVKVAGVWKLAMPFTKVSGIWKRTG